MSAYTLYLLKVRWDVKEVLVVKHKHTLSAERMIIEICSSNGKIYHNKKNWIDLIQQHNQVLLNLNRTMILLLLLLLLG
jgi:hypothetical protein